MKASRTRDCSSTYICLIELKVRLLIDFSVSNLHSSVVWLDSICGAFEGEDSYF